MDSYAKKIFLNWLKYDLRAVEEPLWYPNGGICFPIWHGIHKRSG